MKFFYFSMALVLFLVGCGGEDPVYTPYVQNYSGTYMWRDTTIVFSAAVIDSVEFEITDWTPLTGLISAIVKAASA